MLFRNRKTFIDLFAGIGGFRLVLEKAGLKCVFSSEWDKHSQKTYAANFGERPKGDITKISAEDIPDHDILCAGFPCQAFSISGKQKGFEDTRGTLFFDIARITKEKMPKVLFLENVKNLVRHDKGNTLAVILNTLADLGYDVFYEVLSASLYGSPTARERCYIIAFRKDLAVRNFKFPEPSYEEIYVKDILEESVDSEKLRIKVEPITLTRPVRHESTLKPIQIGFVKKGGQGERIYSIDGHAITFSASGGGIAAKTGAYWVGEHPRKLSPRECARVMGFPDSFEFPVSDSQAYKQLGNSVAIPVIRAIFERIKEQIRLLRFFIGDCMASIKIGTNVFWLETKHVDILDFFKIKELYLGVDMQNQQKPNNVYFAVKSESGLEIRALSYNKFRGSTKLYFWNTQEEIKSFLKPVKRMYILDEGIWADNGYYMVFG